MSAMGLALLIGAASAGCAGRECTTDADCCGGTSKCSSPLAGSGHPEIAATCIDAPAGAPSTPAASTADAVWPSQWVSNVEAWTYPDFSSKAVSARGRFFYDGVGGRTRTEWHPYINGRDATQVWIGNPGSGESSFYYVKTGPLCLKFPITDPGTSATIGIERADWVQNCDRAGLATYVGREVVNGEWADHYVCKVDDTERNMTIAFQNWHALGLGAAQKGLPLRVTGGNTKPDSKKGSPRLSTVWYTNATVGPLWEDDAFTHPRFCIPIPVPKKKVTEFFGEEPTAEHATSPDFMSRAHYLPLAEPAKSDVRRARQKKPRAHLAGADLKEAMARLNAQLVQQALSTAPCDDFNLTALHAAQRSLFHARSPALQDLYHGDNRRLPYATLNHLETVQEDQAAAAAARPHLTEMMRHGLCQELVMMYVHHLTETARQDVSSGSFVLPLLPERNLHAAPAATAAATDHSQHAAYVGRATCAICHVTPAPNVVV